MVPLGAPVLFRNPGMPLPYQRTLSSAWHAVLSKFRSTWQSAGQEVTLASKQEYGVLIAPLAMTTYCCSADCIYCTT